MAICAPAHRRGAFRLRGHHSMPVTNPKVALQTCLRAPVKGGCLTVDMRVTLAPEPAKTSGEPK